MISLKNSLNIVFLSLRINSYLPIGLLRALRFRATVISENLAVQGQEKQNSEKAPR